MTKVRIALLSALLLGVSSAVTSCAVFPAPSEEPTSSPEPTSSVDDDGGVDDDGDEAAASDVAGTSWEGHFDGRVTSTEVEFTLHEDGTVDFASWGDDGSFDDPADVWSGDSENLQVYITQINSIENDDGPFNLRLTGDALDGKLRLTGTGPEGEQFKLEADQVEGE